jgi:HEAT repeat protein
MIEQTLQKLADAKQPLSHRLLRTLSGLDDPALSALRQAWPAIAVTRRQQIVRALVEMAEDDVEMDFVDLFREILTDSDETVRATAISGLWETTDERLMDPLITIMVKDPSASVRAVAAETLGHFSMLASEERLHSNRSKRLLAALLDTWRNKTDPLNTEEVRRNALESVSFFGEEEAVTAAIREAYTDASVILRAAAVAAMGFSFNAAWEPTVLAELKSAEPEMRYEAARASSELLLESAVATLTVMTRDADSEVRLMSIWALGQIGGLPAKACLTQLLESHDESVRDAAEEALEELKFNEDPLDFANQLKPPKGSKGSAPAK